MKQEVQELKAFVFCVVTVNDEPTKPGFKRKISVKLKDGICAESRLKLWFESDCPETNFEANTS